MEKVSDHQECPECSGVMVVNYNPKIDIERDEQCCRCVGEKLIAKTIDVVKELGFNELYLRTEDGSDYYRKGGWTYLETVSDDKYEKIDVFKIKCI